MESDETEKKAILEQIPTAYHQYWEVFSERASYRFPPEREEDHAIILKEGAPDKIDCKIYRQTAEELEATRQFISESLAKGYITDSKSPYASALFYRKKKDGKLRPIMDYRILNKWTVRDNYPLPLITNIIDRLQGKTLFSKFDIRWGYNNIRVTVPTVTLAHKVGPGLQDLQTRARRILAERNAEKAEENTWIGRMVAAENINDIKALIKSRDSA